MNEKELLGHLGRLRADLIGAYSSPACRTGLIERLTVEIEQARRRYRAEHSGDEQGGDGSLAMSYAGFGVASELEPER